MERYTKEQRKSYNQEYYQKNKKKIKKEILDNYYKNKSNIKLTSTKIKATMQPKILYSPSTILSDYMSTSLKNKIVDLVNSRSFIMKRFISGEQKKIWITRVGENSYRWAVKNKNGDRPEETKDFNDTIAILHCFSCPVEEVEEAIEKEEDKVVPFLDTYLTLLNACDYKEVYGHYFVEF